MLSKQAAGLPKNKLFDHVRRLASIRKESEALRRGQTIDLTCTKYSYAFARVAGNQRIIAVFHDGADAETLRIPVKGAGFEEGGHLTDVLGELARNRWCEIYLPARSATLSR